MNEESPATVEEAVHAITAVQKPILPTLSVERLADLLPSAVLLAAVVALGIGAATLIRSMGQSGIATYLLR